MNKITRG